tara:strand:- start:190 stop:369 length:180 start_codon:yes stop_codon:yes gene_type:complete
MGLYICISDKSLKIIEELKNDYPEFTTSTIKEDFIEEALEWFLGEVKDAKETMQEFKDL